MSEPNVSPSVSRPCHAFVLVAPEPPFEFDNDCACPDGVVQLATAASSGGSWVRTPQIVTCDLPGGFTMAWSPLTSRGPCVLSPAAMQRLAAFQFPQPLVKAIDNELAEQQLLQPKHAPYAVRELPPETLTAWLHITNACNLDCPYCYVRKSSARMSAETGLRSVEQIIATAHAHGFRRVKLKYAGGEATLHMRLVRQLHEHAVALAADAGIVLREVVLSNGVALREADANWLAEAGIKLMISLDGVGVVHDAQRYDTRGHGSFAAVERTVDCILLPRGIRPDITVTVTQRNAADAAGAVEWALHRGLPVSLNFYREGLLTRSRADLALNEQAIIDGMRKAYAVIENHMPTYSLVNGLLDRVQASAHRHTCGVGISYLVITHEGNIGQCQMHLEAATPPPNSGEMIRLVARGPIQNLPVDSKETCRECSFRYVCAGGCPIETFRATGRWDVSSPHCNIYRTLFPEVLRIEGLRLLKVHGWL